MKQTVSRHGWSMRLLLIALLAAPAAHADDAPPASKSTVGMPARIEQRVLPGSELEVRPIDDRRAPIVLRILGVYPHGTAFRYDFVYYGLDPGTYDLKDLLAAQRRLIDSRLAADSRADRTAPPARSARAASTFAF